MQTQFQLGNYIHECTNETHFLAKLQDLIPTLAGLCFLNLVAGFTIEYISFMHAWINYSAEIVFV